MKFLKKGISILFCFFTISSFGQGTNKDLLHKIHNGTDERRDSLAAAYSVLRDSLSTSKSKIKQEVYLKSLELLDRLTEENNAKELSLEFDFIKNNPNDSLALEIMLYKIYRRESVNKIETFNLLYANLSSQLKQSEQGINLRKILLNIEHSKVGSLAPDFSFVDLHGQRLSLDSFRHKNYILLDFWASWCAPCRADFPFLKNLYNAYHAKGLEIINISRDEDIELWKKAIKHDGIDIWRQISTKQNENKILGDYFVSAIPVKVLIDKEGIIIGRWRGGGDSNQIELTELLSKKLDSK